MAIDPKSLTVDYRTLQAIPFRDRRALLYSSYADQINSALTPGQRANLFPSYYQRDAAAAKSALTGASGMLGGSGAANRERTGAGVGFSDSNTVEGQPEKKGPPAITASEFRAVEANPFLAGYADKTRRVESSNSKFGNFSPREKATLDFISKREGSKNQDIIFGDIGNKPGTGKYSRALGLDKRPLSDHSIAEVITLQKKLTAITGADGVAGGVGTSAVGTGQMIRGTLIGNLRSLGIPEEDWDKIKFDETLQKRLTLENFRTSGIGNPNGDPRQWNHTVLGKQYESLDTSKGFNAMSSDEMDSIIKASPERPKEFDEQTATPDAMSVVQEVASQTVSAAELKSVAEGLDVNATTESALNFLNNKERNPDGANLVDVDSRLLEITEMGIRKFESENPNLKVEIYGPGSGKRTSSVTQDSQHLKGRALDFEIFEIDPKTGKKTGKRLANFPTQAGAGEAGDEYLRLHQNIELARIYKKDVLKDDRYKTVYGRSGALFGGDYAFDTQHYDIGGLPARDGVQSLRQPGGSIFGGYTEEYMKRFGVEKTAMAIEPEKLPEMAKLAYGPKQEIEPTVATLPEPKTPVLPKDSDSVSKAQPAATSTNVTPPVQVADTTTTQAQEVVPTQTAETTATTTGEPQSQTTPIKTMAQGGIVPSYGENEIVTRAPTSGEVIQRTKISEYGSEQVKVEPISKMKAEALTPVKNDLDVAPQMNEDQQKPAMQRSSMTASKIPSSPYSNITSEIKKPTATALRAALQIRMGNTAMGDYVA